MTSKWKFGAKCDSIGNANTEDEHLPINQLFFRYAPTFVIFTDNKAPDSVEHDAYLQYQHTFSKLDFKLEQRFQHLTGNEEETGARINRKQARCSSEMTSSHSNALATRELSFAIASPP